MYEYLPTVTCLRIKLWMRAPVLVQKRHVISGGLVGFHNLTMAYVSAMLHDNNQHKTQITLVATNKKKSN